MIVAIAAGQPRRHIFERRFREDGDAVIGLLAVDREIVAKFLEGRARKGRVLAFDFLEADDVGCRFLEPGEHGFEPGLDRIDVPGRNAHPGRTRARSRSWCRNRKTRSRWDW